MSKLESKDESLPCRRRCRADTRTTIGDRTSGRVGDDFEERMLTAIARIIADSEARSQEFARGVETKLLTAFHKFAERQEARKPDGLLHAS